MAPDTAPSAGQDRITTTAAPAPRRVAVRCPVCTQTFDLGLTVEPKVSFGWSGTKGFLTANVGISGIEHRCERPDRCLTPQ